MGLQDFSPLRDRFAAASDRWPNLQTYLITWPQNQPAPEELPGVDMMGHNGLSSPAPPGDMHFTAVLTGGGRPDMPQYRYRDGRAGWLLLRWNFGRFGRSPREVDNPDELVGMEQRFKTLAGDGARILGKVGPDVGLSERTLTWKDHTRWLLALFETLGPEPRQSGCYQIETIGDVFLASAQAIGRWVVVEPELAPEPELQPEDVDILRYLYEKPKVARVQEDIAAGADMDRKTAGKRLTALRKIRYVKRPEGRKRGDLITDAGIARLGLILGPAKTSPKLPHSKMYE